jgi:hypothetical protein
VSDVTHAMHVPEHAVSQQIWLPAGPTQLPLEHCDPDVHELPLPFGAHVPPWQSPLWQSPSTTQPTPLAQRSFCASHCAPPQSLPVSLPSFTPSMHETHVPGPEP